MMNPDLSGTRALACWSTFLILSASLPCKADDFVFDVAAPKFKVTLPGIPRLKMEMHPHHASHPHMRFLGSEEPYTIAVITPAAAAGMTPPECASAIARSLAARPGMPPPSQVFKTRLNANTFAAFYAVPLVGAVQLHAHFLSAAGGTHCIEVHATKVSFLEDDLASWIDDFAKASIEPD